jgi:hypothetical protein
MAFPTGGAALVRYIRGVERLAAHWRAVLPSNRFIGVEYEALTVAPDAEIRRIVAECGLNWDGACLHPERNTRVIKTASKFQARQAIYRGVEKAPAYRPFLGALAALE